MIAANQWYNIAETDTIGTRTGIRIDFGTKYALFTVSVDYGNSVISAVESNISKEETKLSVRIRQNNNAWYVDVRMSVAQDTTLKAALYENTGGWEAVAPNTSVVGNTICIINDLTSHITPSGGGESLFERINVGTAENPLYAVVPKKYNGVEVGIISNTFMSMAGFGLPDDVPAVAPTLSDLNDVQITEPAAGDVLTYDDVLGTWVNGPGGLNEDALSKYLQDKKYITDTLLTNALKGYLTVEVYNAGVKEINKKITAVEERIKWFYYDEENNAIHTSCNFISDGTMSMAGVGGSDVTPAVPNITIKLGEVPYDSVNGVVSLPAYPSVGLDENALESYLTTNQYAKKSDIPSLEGYARKSDLNTLRTDFDNLYNLLNTDVTGVINTWHEVVDFLDEYSGSEDLATILSGMNTDIANNANNIAINATAITAVSNRVQKFEDVIGIDANGDVYIKGTRNFYTAGGTIGMAGLGSGGTGGGGTAGLGSVTVRVNGQDYITDASGIVTIPSYPTSLPASDVFSWAKKSSLALADVPDLSSKYAAIGLAGSSSYVALKNGGYIAYRGGVDWNITNGDWSASYKILHEGNYADTADKRYLQLGGGTISKSSYVPLVIQNTASDLSTILYKGTSGDLGYLGFNGASNPIYMAPSGYAYTLIHSGNLADTIDKRYLQLSGGTIGSQLTIASSTDNKIILNETGSDVKYQYIEFQNQGVRYGTLGTFGNDYIKWNNNILIHSGNYADTTDKRYLQLSGGTMDGAVVFKSSAPAIAFLRESGTPYIRFGATTSLGYGEIGVNSNGDAVFWSLATANSGYNKWNTLIHSGNYSNYALPLSGGTMTGAILIGGYTSFGVSDGIFYLGNPSYPVYVRSNGIVNINGNAVIHAGNIGSHALKIDGSNAMTAPLILAYNSSLTKDKGIYVGTTNVAGGAAFDYASFVNIHDNGGSSLQLSWYRNVYTPQVAMRLSENGSWSAWKAIAFTDSNVASATYASSAGSADVVAKTYGNQSINFANNESKLRLIKWGGSANAIENGFPEQYTSGLSVMTDYTGWQMVTYGSIGKPNPYFRSFGDDGRRSEWKQLAFLTDNVASATKLQTARKIWGRSFDGTADVWGSMSGVNAIVSNTTNGYFVGNRDDGLGVTTGGLLLYSYGSTPISFWTNQSERMHITASGNILIGTTTDAGYKFAVNGGALANTVRTQELRLGEANPDGSVTQAKSYHATIGYVYEDNSPHTLKPAIVFKSMYDTYSEGSGNELMRIRANGNVLIGTPTGSGYKLDVNGTICGRGNIYCTGSSWIINDTANVGLYNSAGDARWYYYSHFGGWYSDKAIQTSRYYFSGYSVTGSSWNWGAGALNVNIPNDSGQTPLIVGFRKDTSASTSGPDRLFALELLDTGAQLRYSWGGAAKHIFYNNGNVEFSGKLTVTGDIISEGTIAMAKLASSSDRKLKDNIAKVSAEQSMSIIRQLRPTTWNWKKDGKKSYGFIAQEVEPIVPEMVADMGHLHLEYNQLHAFEIGAIKHIDSEVDILKRELKKTQKQLKAATKKIGALELQLNDYRRAAICQ